MTELTIADPIAQARQQIAEHDAKLLLLVHEMLDYWESPDAQIDVDDWVKEAKKVTGR